VDPSCPRTRACSRARSGGGAGELTSVKTDDLVAELDYSSPGAPPARGVYVAEVDAKAEGGLTEVAPLYTAPDAAGCTAPFQK
jgi:hypothetical protein